MRWRLSKKYNGKKYGQLLRNSHMMTIGALPGCGGQRSYWSVNYFIIQLVITHDKTADHAPFDHLRI